MLAACAREEPPTPGSIMVLDRSKLTAVEANLKTDPELAASNIRVSARNDTVVLEGNVPSAEARQKAEALARRVPGIEKVDNRLAVVPPGGGESP